MNKLYLICTLILMISYPLSAMNNIIEVRNNLTEINIKLHNNQQPGKEAVENLMHAFSQLKTEIEYNNNSEETLAADLEAKISQLKYLDEVKAHIDTLSTLVRAINGCFNTLYGTAIFNIIKEKPSKKIILLASSVSCECTIEMCNNQEYEIQKLLNSYPHKYEYAVIDTWKAGEFLDKYDAGFIPTVILLDENNNIIGKYIRTKDLSKEIINKIK